MIIGFNFFGDYEGSSVFETMMVHSDYYRTELKDGIIDEIYIDEDTTITNSTTKPNSWGFKTVLDAKFQDNLEGGSIQASGETIDSVLFQRRKTDELYWNDVAKIEYSQGETTFYEIFDKFIQNDEEYEYSILPLAVDVKGERILSNPITADFEGYFISDKDNNYRLYYNAEFDTLTHNNPSAIHEPLNSQYPIVTYGQLNYRQGNLKALILSDSTISDHEIDVRAEKKLRQQLMSFLNNRKPKIIRGQNGELLLITIVGNTQEEHNNKINGIANVSFEFVEIGNTDSDTLKSYDLIEWA